MSDERNPIYDSVEADQQAANTVVIDDEQDDDGEEVEPTEADV